ncbi:MAG: serine/threonine protein kinase [Rhizobacter sp.]|nr:serine/threonine protein kinase [Rhizobacter sp.]
MNGEIALPAGYALQEYRIESTLGVGGFGLTYLATDRNLNMPVAIKEYLPGDLALRCDDRSVRSKSESAEARFAWGRTRFLDESRTLASFRHPNIVRVLRFFEANQTAYMVMEFVAGQPLDQWMKTRRPVTEPTLIGLALALLDGIDVIHRAGVLHRDVKPGNIFVRHDGEPVLLDFGSARAASVDAERTAIVSPGFAPLEQYHAHGNQGPWSDLYAVGAVLYWAVTGHKPMEATARVPVDPMTPASRAADAATYSPTLLQAIDWALRPAERARPQSVAEIRGALAARAEALDADIKTTYADRTELSSGAPSPPAASVPTAFADDMLKAMSLDLAAYLGPVAAVVVKSAAKKASDLAGLAERLAADINDSSARARFLKKYAAASAEDARSRPDSARQPVTGAGASSASTFDPALLERAEAELAQHIGAVAKAVVRRAAGQARSETELFALLAEQIDDPVGRKAFVRKAMSVSGRV